MEVIENRVVPHWYMYPPKSSYQPSTTIYYKNLPEISERFSIYVHVPFCNMKCSFCSLFTSSGYNESAVKKYIAALKAEIGGFRDRYPSRRASVLYFGGGTPALLSQEYVDELMEYLEPTLSEHPIPRSVEFSPDVVDAKVIATWRAHDFDRASLGVQSFDNRRLERMRRRHSGLDAFDAIERLADDFDRVNVDLIFGGHDQTHADWESDLEKVVRSSADSCTFHPLAVVGKTAFERKLDDHKVQSKNLQELHELAIKTFTDAGWERTSAISFSRSGVANPIETAEANGEDTFGFGAGARSYIGELHLSTLPTNGRVPFGEILKSYYDAVSERVKPAMSAVTLDSEEIARRKLILKLHHGKFDELPEGDLAAQLFADLLVEIVRHGPNSLDPTTSMRVPDNIMPHVAEIGLAVSSEAVRLAVEERFRQSQI